MKTRPEKQAKKKKKKIINASSSESAPEYDVVAPEAA
jgi:hypothetical protein